MLTYGDKLNSEFFFFFFVGKMILLHKCNHVLNISVSSFYRMPPIYQFDDYDKCLSVNPSTYCIVYAEIEPNHFSQLWNQIDIYSKDINRHFRHDRLHFGVCIERCKILLESLTVFERQQLYDKRVEKNEVSFDQSICPFTKLSLNDLNLDKISINR